MTLIDTHCHLTAPELFEQVDAVLARALAAGVTRCVLVGTNPADARRAAAILVERPQLALIAGVHPHEAAHCTRDTLAALEELLRGVGLPAGVRERIVGVGETGIDTHYDFAPAAVQETVFRAQLQLALRYDRPVVVHARAAERRVCDVLAEYAALAGRVVFHCFSGDVALARRALDLGHYCSFTGVVTFRKAEAIQAAARFVPLDRLLLETDAPYLSPEPVRKVRPNEPALLAHTAAFVAALREITVAELAAATTTNAMRFFRWPKEAVCAVS